MRRTRQVLLIAMVATALCADRAVAAAPQSANQMNSVAARLVNSLSERFGRSVSTIRLQQVRQAPVLVSVQNRVTEIPAALAPAHLRAWLPGLLESRLPPPSL
jgi:hypothetical protein